MSQGTPISKASVILAIDASGINRGLVANENAVDRWGKNVEGKVAGTTDRLTQHVGKLASFLKGGALAVLAAGAAGVVAAISKVGDALQDISDINKGTTTAKTFGIDPSEFSVISGIAKESGSDLRDFTESLITMTNRLCHNPHRAVRNLTG